MHLDASNVRMVLPLYFIIQLSCVTFDPAAVQTALASDGGQNDETLRRVERGSRIVTVVPQDTRVILQVRLTHFQYKYHGSATNVTVCDCAYYHANSGSRC